MTPDLNILKRNKFKADDAEEILFYKGGSLYMNSGPNSPATLFIERIIKPIAVVQSPYQTIVIARMNGHTAMFLNGEWQFISGEDNEKRFHYAEAYVPASLVQKESPDVLIIGGGDGLAARDVLQAKPKAKITLVELDEYVIRVCKTLPEVRSLNKGSLDKIKVVIGDGLKFMNSKKNKSKFDLVIIDLPDPIRPETANLYGDRLINGVLNALRTGGNFSIYSMVHGSPLQSYLANRFKPYFRKVMKVGIKVKDMGKAGFVYGIHKKGVKNG